MWHSEDSKSTNHRARARLRQGGKDKPTAPIRVTRGANTRSAPTTAPPNSGNTSPQTTPPVPSGSGNTTRSQPQALTGVKIKKLPGSITGQLFISERQEGDK